MSKAGASKPLGLAAIGLAMIPAGASAQSGSAEIVVTGERVARRAADTPSSLVALSGAELEALAGADRLDQVLALVPNVQLGSGGEGPAIRGQDSTGPLRDLPAFLGGNRPRVTLQVDGQPISYNELAFGVANLWDVDRIEVFRSPQTTTQGRNAIAGAIFVETAEPTFDWEARIRLLGGSDDLRQTSAFLSGPIVGNALAFRASADVRRGRTSSRISSTALNVDYNRDDYDNLRLRLLLTPAALPGFRLSAIASRNRSASPQIEGVREPFKARSDPTATYGFFRQRVDALTLRGYYPFAPGWTATATATFGNALVRRFAPPGFGETRIAADDWTSEAIITWRSRPGLDLLLGINRTHAALSQDIDLRAAQLGLGRFSDGQDALGLFGQMEWRLASTFTATVGVRYQRDDQHREGTLGLTGSSPLPLDFTGRFSRLLPKATLTYHPRPGWRMGVMAQRAYNPGGVTIDGGRRAIDTFGAESLWAYEAFARFALDDDRLELSVNVFHYDIADAQRTLTRELPTPAGVVTFVEIDNAPKARSSGAEMAMDWRPVQGLRLQGAVGLLRTKLTRAQSQTDPLQGKEFQRSPDLTANMLAEWRPRPTLRLSAQVRHNTGYFSDDANDPLRRIDPATVADVRGGWTTGSLTVSAYIRNLFDTFYLTHRNTAATRLATAGDPREFGAAVDLRF